MSHCIRQNSDLVALSIRLIKTYKSYYYQQYKLFNKLPVDTRILPEKTFQTCYCKMVKTKGVLFYKWLHGIWFM